MMEMRCKMDRENKRSLCDTCENADECYDDEMCVDLCSSYVPHTSSCVPYMSFELVEAPSKGHMNKRDWKKTQKKIRRERRQRGTRK